MHGHPMPRVRQNPDDLLRFPQTVPHNDRLAARRKSAVNQLQQLRYHLFPRRKSEIRQAISAFHHQHVGLSHLGYRHGGTWAKLEIPRV